MLANSCEQRADNGQAALFTDVALVLARPFQPSGCTCNKMYIPCNFHSPKNPPFSLILSHEHLVFWNRVKNQLTQSIVH